MRYINLHLHYITLHYKASQFLWLHNVQCMSKNRRLRRNLAVCWTSMMEFSKTMSHPALYGASYCDAMTKFYLYLPCLQVCLTLIFQAYFKPQHREVNRLLVAVILATYCVFLPTQPSRYRKSDTMSDSQCLTGKIIINDRMLHLKSKQFVCVDYMQ